MRPLRLFGVTVGAIAVVALGLAYPLIELGDEVTAIQWDRPWWLLALVAVPLVLYVGTLGEDARVPRLRIGNGDVARTVPHGFRARLRDLPGVLRAGALALVAVALARPQTLSAAESDERSGIDIMIALDLSGSMRAADLKPTRLEAAKAEVQNFIETRRQDRIGAVVFGRDAFPLSSLTFDHGRLAQLVGRLELGVLNGEGTAIGEGLGMALAPLRRSRALSRVIVLLTDGDSNAGKMSPEEAMLIAQKLSFCEKDCPATCAQDDECPDPYKCSVDEHVCKRDPVKIYTVQMGNGDEAPVQVGVDAFGRAVYRPMSFPVNPELLKKISSETGGESYVATETEQLRSSMNAILDNLKKTTFSQPADDMVERFPLVLAPAVALVVLEALLRALLLRRFP